MRLVQTAKRMLVGLTVFFFIASLAQLIYLHTQISNAPNLDVLKSISQRISKVPSEQEQLPLIELESRLALEVLALKRRYHQANVLLMSRIWVSYLSFVTGMILCLVGASFILGKVREPPAEIKADSKFFTFAIASSSPGIILATLGTFLVVTSIMTNHRIAVLDRPVYLIPPGSNVGTPRQIPGPHEEPANPDDVNLDILDDILDKQ